jgi:translocon-associated protein subunit beta
MKFLIILALAALACFVNGNDEEETGARLLISKQILNKYLVEDMDIVVKVCTAGIF